LVDSSGLSDVKPLGWGPHGAEGSPEDEYTGEHEPDMTEPWDVGSEFMTGTGPQVHVFHDGDKFLEQLKQSDHLRKVQEELKSKLHDQCYTCDETPIYDGKAGRSLGGLKGVAVYLEDWLVNAPASVTRTDKFFGVNPSTVYLGSFGMEYWVKPIDCCEGRATVRFHAWNSSTLVSLTRPPVTGYISWLDWPRRKVMDWLDDVLPQRPVYQIFYWEEELEFEGNEECP
jgi:hypothetical protein